VNDGSGFDPDNERIEIDVRSPGERWAEAGRVEFDRVRVLLEDGRLDVVALVWMLLLLSYTGLQIYNAWNFGSFGSIQNVSGWWTRLAFLAQTGGFLLIFGGLAAIVMAAFFDTTVARVALYLAMLGGAWTVATAMFGIAVAFHVEQSGPVLSNGENKYVQAFSAAALGGLGLLMAFVAWRMSVRTVWEDEGDDDAAELAELS
jgi:hypothetical protein